MTTPLTKLIEDNKWRPIAELTLDYYHGYAVSKRIIVKCSYPETNIFNVYCTRVWEENGERSLPDIQYGEYDRITHFRPLPDDRLALVAEVLLEGIKEILQNGVQVVQGDYSSPKNNKCKHGQYGYEECAACTDEFLEALIQRATAIAQSNQHTDNSR